MTETEETTDTAPVLKVWKSHEGHPNEQFPTAFWENERHAVSDGVNVSTGSSHYAALHNYWKTFYPDDEYDVFLNRFETIEGSLRGKLLHGFYNKTLHFFYCDYVY